MDIEIKDRSLEIDKIMGALAAAQGTYKSLVANQDAPGTKFANLQAILLAVKESLANNGLAFYQHTKLLDEGSGAALLISMLGHSSGQYISSTARVVSGKNSRQTGNIYEIHKRFHALMLLGIAPSDSDPMAFDDNGTEQADTQLMEEIRKPKNSSTESEIRKRQSPDALFIPVNKDQYNELIIELDGYPEILKDILEVYAIETIADLPQEEYHKARSKIMKIKKVHDDYQNRK